MKTDFKVIFLGLDDDKKAMDFCKNYGITFYSSKSWSIPFSVKPYDFVILDPNTMFIDDFSGINRYFGSAFTFVLNKEWLGHHLTSFFFEQFLKEFFSITSTFEKRHFIIDPKLDLKKHKKISSKFHYEMSPFYGFFRLNKNTEIEIIHSVKNNKEVVSFKTKSNNLNRWLVPFSELNRSCWEYLCNQFKDWKSGRPLSILTEPTVILNQIFTDIQGNKVIFYPDYLKTEILTIQKLKDDLEKIRHLKAQKEKINVDFVKEQLKVLTTKGEELESAILNLFNQKEIKARKPCTKGTEDLYFDHKGKHILCEITATTLNTCQKTSILKKKFSQLNKWAKLFLSRNTNRNNDSLILLLIVNNQLNAHPGKRCLKLDTKTEQQYSKRIQGIQFKLVFTIDLIRILNSKNGKNIFLDKLLNEQIQIS